MSGGKEKSRLRSLLWNVLRLGVTAIAIWYVVNQITWKDRLIVDGRAFEGWLHVEGDQRTLVTDAGRVLEVPDDADDPDAKDRFVPGILTIFSHVKIGYVVAAIATCMVTILLGGIRWQWLLQAHNLDPTAWQAIRLNWMGFLSNNVLPGSTGGDIVKAVCISRRTPGKRTSAIMTVLLDRVVGFVALIIMGAIGVGVKWFRAGGGPIDRAGQLVLLMLTAVVVGGVFFFSQRVRRFLRVSHILDRIPFGATIRKIDDSVFHYRHHKAQLGKAIGIGLVIWLLTISAIIMLGQSMSMQVAFVDYVICLPVIFTAGAVAPSIAGLGVLEGLFQHFFGQAGAAPAVAVALCLMYRLEMLIASLPGAIPLFQEFSSHSPEIVASLSGEAPPEPA